MKPKIKETNENRSEPPALAGGSDMVIENDSASEAPLSRVGTPPTDAGGSDLMELRSENEQLRTQIRLDRAHRRITGELEQAGARSPELMFESVKGDLQFDGEDEIANAAALIKRLKTAFPEQFGFTPPPSIDGGAGLNQEPRLSREALAKMKPAEIAALDWNDVRRVLAG